MKKGYFLPLALLLGLSFFTACENTNSTKMPIPEASADPVVTMPDKVLRHVVLFKFKAATSAEEIDRINKDFRGLSNLIPSIKDFEWGLNNSPEDLDQGFTHCYTLTFHSEKDRDDYIPNSHHQAFVKSIGPFVEKAFVVDYWAN